MHNRLKLKYAEGSGRFSLFISLAVLVLAVVILRGGKVILVPIALAAMIAFLLWPLVQGLKRLGLSKTLAVVAASVMAFTFLTLVAWFITVQTWEVVRDLPRYEQNLDAKVAGLKESNQSASIRPVAEMIGRFEKELMAPGESVGRDGHEPVSVRVEPVRKSPLAAMGQIAFPVLGPLATAGIVIVFVIAILMQRDDLLERFLKLGNPEKTAVIRHAIDDASVRVYRYLSMQLVVNSCYGIFVGLGLRLIGIPNVALWGLAAMLLRFIPYLGPWVAAACPVALAMAIEPGWWKVGWTLGLFMAAELVTANIVEIVLYGAAAGVSSVSLMFAAVFWTWIWGGPGLFLSTPLTVVLMVMGYYIPALRIFSVLFGREITEANPPFPRLRSGLIRPVPPRPATNEALKGK